MNTCAVNTAKRIPISPRPRNETRIAKKPGTKAMAEVNSHSKAEVCAKVSYTTATATLTTTENPTTSWISGVIRYQAWSSLPATEIGALGTLRTSGIACTAPCDQRTRCRNSRRSEETPCWDTTAEFSCLPYQPC